jgi:ABC-type polysaccharide/polyol phosphate transport system ATPase subunit
MSAAISFEQVSKSYRGAQTYRALRDDLARLVRFRRAPRETVDALADLSFDVNEGESTALIGLNGAGKTTALKLISRITYPTTGMVRVRGRVGALIEVGTGMHPELTGRENTQLYGRILGLSGRDIDRRFDEIVEFAGIGSAIDRPVKHYSSGMQLRLGFSVAAHVEPDVLLVDEAIAVGDAGFQYRCVERMAQLVREGRTLVFVSHDMSAVETLCRRAVMLDHGRIAKDGPAREVVREYMEAVQSQQMASDSTGYAAGDDFEITRVSLHDSAGAEVAEIETDQPLTVRLHFRAAKPLNRPIFSVGLNDMRAGCFTMASMLIDGQSPDLIDGEGHVDCTFAELPLQPKAYEIWGEVIGESGFGEIIDWQRLRVFRVMGDPGAKGKSAVTHSMADAPVRLPYRWDVAN